MLRKSLEQDLMKVEGGFFEKGRKAEIGEIRRFGDSDWKKTAEGWEYLRKNKLYQINERFNEDLEKQIKGELPKGYKYNIGYPEDKLLSAGFPKREIHMMATSLSLKSSDKYKNKHPFNLKDIKNLPLALNNPIFVLNSKTQSTSKVVITDLTSNGINILVALQIDFKEKDAIVISIRSIYPKESLNAIKDWVMNGLLIWRDKEKSLKFSSKLQSNSAEVGENNNDFQQKLKRFINPSFSEHKDILKKSMEQQFGPEYFEKAKKGAEIGTIKEFGGKKYINDSLIFCCPYQ